ncbi:MAG: hypothetical protein V8R82_09885 [Clostridia bacterium]
MHNHLNKILEEQQVTSQGIINGDLNYSAPNEISIPEGSVSGSANYSKSTENLL